MATNTWCSFCISTFKRPVILHEQLTRLSQQAFREFEVVVSDNDPEGSAREVVNSFDTRFKYYHNNVNLGMIPSFNMSIRRATTPYIIMVTDDDPVDNDFLSAMHSLWKKYPGYAVYAGVERTNVKSDQVEVIAKEDFIPEILDPRKTPRILWSSCVVDREQALSIGCIPEYGSPHLADHAFLALAGNNGSGIFVNHFYSHLTSHDSNFSKTNFQYYTNGCAGFYNLFESKCKDKPDYERYRKVMIRHLGTWFIANMFNLKRYYVTKRKDKQALKELEQCAQEILLNPFMSRYRGKYQLKKLIFAVKKWLRLLP